MSEATSPNPFLSGGWAPLRREVEIDGVEVIQGRVPEALRGATLTLSNFGALGGRHATLVVMPPQVAIVGAGRIHPAVLPIDGRPVVAIGHQKGRTTKEKLDRHFGMPRPEGYRKAMRLMRMAEKFRLPVLTFIDTPGAYPGVGAEERGQSEAIARCLYLASGLRTPIVSVVTGEGGSGGADRPDCGHRRRQDGQAVQAASRSRRRHAHDRQAT